MDQTRLKRLERRIEDLLPQGKGFIMVLFDFGVASTPILVTNTDEEAAFEAIRAILNEKDVSDNTSLN